VAGLTEGAQLAGARIQVAQQRTGDNQMRQSNSRAWCDFVSRMRLRAPELDDVGDLPMQMASTIVLADE